MLLHLHEIDRLPIPTKVSAEFKGTVCTKRNLIEPVQVSPTSVKRFRILFKTPLFFITVIMPIATLNLGTIKICEFLLFVSFLLCSVLSFSSYLSLLFVMSFLLPNFLFFSTFLVTFFHFFFFSLSLFRQRLNQTQFVISSRQRPTLSQTFTLPSKLVETFTMGVETFIFRKSVILSCLYMTASRGFGNFRQDLTVKEEVQNYGARLNAVSFMSPLLWNSLKNFHHQRNGCRLVCVACKWSLGYQVFP